MTPLQRFAHDLHDHLTQDPQDRLTLGLLTGLGKLPDPSLAALDTSVAEARMLLAQLDAIDRASLDAHEALDADIARLMLQEEIFRDTVRFNGERTATQKPDAADAIGDSLFLMFISDPRPAGERLADITSVLQGVPAYLDAMASRLRAPVARWVQIELDKAGDLPELFGTVEGWAAELGWADLPRLQAARADAEAALTAYTARLGALPTTEHLHLGEAATRELIAHKGVPYSLDELHGIATRFLRDVSDTLETLRERISARYNLPVGSTVDDVHHFLNAHFRVPVREGHVEDVLDHYQTARRSIDTFIAAQDLFPIPADQDMRILRTPGFMAPTIPAGAMMPPPPFREGTRTSLVYLTLSEALLDEHNLLGIPMMMVHEGIPGHHLQLAWAANNRSIIRRHCDSQALAEGWTTMLEDYMLDMGLMGDLTDEARFIMKRDIARIGARVAIDLYFMTGHKRYLEVGVPCDLSSPDPFVAAGHLLKAVTGFTDGRVQAELNWYSLERGYPLSYLTGNTYVWALKREVEAANGGPSVALDRRFHKTFLEAGNIPIRLLRRAFVADGLLSEG